MGGSSAQSAVLVTGGSSGIGRAIAVRLARPGGTVVITYHNNEESAQETAAEIREKGATAHAVRTDIAAVAEIDALIAEVGRVSPGGLDVIVHAAAEAMTGRLVDLDGETLDRALRANGASIVHLVRAAQGMLHPGSSVIYVTSKGSERAMDAYGPLGAPKAFAEHAVRYLARELAARGVRINSISPGPLDTVARRSMFPDTWQSRLDAQTAANPTGRALEFEDVAGVVELMIDPRWAMVQGQVITVDGGLTL